MKWKNLVEAFNIRFELAEKRINKPEDRSMEVMKSEEQREKKIKKINRALGKCGISLSTPTYI